jgi:alpha-L-arabinofuranosidase
LNRWGLYVQAGKPYEGGVWARCESPTEVTVALESADGGQVYGESTLPLEAGSWRRLDFTLTPSQTDKDARFAIKLTHPGSVVLGYAFLQPGSWGRFKGLPVRKDVAEALVAQGLTVLRYGGSMVNIDTYRWKNMIGPRDLRPAYRGHWFRYSSNGWGIIDFIDFCRAAGFLSIPAFNMGESPQDMADFVEYVNGPINSEWGRQRARDGHPEPYHLRYMELGNEEAVDEGYWQRFKPMAEAIWQKDPNITIVVGDFAYDRPIRDPYDFSGAPRIRSLAAHKKILDLAVQHEREVWFDVHIWTGEPRQPDGLGGVPSFIAALRNLNPQARFKVAIFELNANNHALRRALSNAHAINELKRLGDDVPVVCSANCLQPYQQNENGWDQGLLFLDPSQVWGQPPYYVTQMMSTHYQPLCVETTVECPDRCLDVTATCSKDGRTTVLSVVNVASEPVETSIRLPEFSPEKDTAKVMTLTGQLGDINTPEEPGCVTPTKSSWRLTRDAGSGELVYTFGANSFTLLTFE